MDKKKLKLKMIIIRIKWNVPSFHSYGGNDNLQTMIDSKLE